MGNLEYIAKTTKIGLIIVKLFAAITWMIKEIPVLSKVPCQFQLFQSPSTVLKLKDKQPSLFYFK